MGLWQKYITFFVVGFPDHQFVLRKEDKRWRRLLLAPCSKNQFLQSAMRYADGSVDNIAFLEQRQKAKRVAEGC